jgi:hypothetical protein
MYNTRPHVPPTAFAIWTQGLLERYLGTCKGISLSVFTNEEVRPEVFINPLRIIAIACVHHPNVGFTMVD